MSIQTQPQREEKFISCRYLSTLETGIKDVLKGKRKRIPLSFFYVVTILVEEYEINNNILPLEVQDHLENLGFIQFDNEVSIWVYDVYDNFVLPFRESLKDKSETEVEIGGDHIRGDHILFEGFKDKKNVIPRFKRSFYEEYTKGLTSKERLMEIYDISKPTFFNWITSKEFSEWQRMKEEKNENKNNN